MSFRIRLFVITALIVAAVLASVTTLGWSGVLRHQVDRLDERLCMEARRIAGVPSAERRGSLDSDVAGKLGLASSEQLLMLVEAGDGAAPFRSSTRGRSTAGRGRRSPRPRARS